MRYLLRVTLIHRWVQDGTLLDVVRNEVWSSSVKIKNGVSTNILSKSNHTHRGVISE